MCYVLCGLHDSSVSLLAHALIMEMACGTLGLHHGSYWLVGKPLTQLPTLREAGMLVRPVHLSHSVPQNVNLTVKQNSHKPVLIPLCLLLPRLKKYRQSVIPLKGQFDKNAVTMSSEHIVKMGNTVRCLPWTIADSIACFMLTVLKNRSAIAVAPCH